MQQIGRYIVVRELGRGAMGVVYEARDPLINRTVAVKIIRLDALGSSSEAEWLQERLFREARSAGALSHPGIVVIHDLGRYEDVAYIAMERVDGPTLEQVLATGASLGTAESLSILRQTAAALDYAHQNDVVHRDIKPGNLMLHKGVTLKVTDFGIAKIASTQQLTRTGTVMGTPSYMSPEQITAQPVDGRADQFSLAVIAFQLLAGRKPFQGDTLATLVHQIVYEERPSARPLRPNLPEAADAVLKRGLSRDAGDRYPSCAAFVEALEHSLAQAPQPVMGEEEPAAPQIPTHIGRYNVVRELGRTAAPAAPSLPPPGPPSTGFPATSEPQPTKGPAAGKGGWGRWIAAAAAFAAIAALAILFLRQPAPVIPGSVPSTASRPSAVPAPVVTTFTASPSSVKAGEYFLEWSVANATAVRIDPILGPQKPTGRTVVLPGKTTTFTLLATGAGGQTRRAVAVAVVEPPSASAKAAVGEGVHTGDREPSAGKGVTGRHAPVVTFTATPSSIRAGEPALLEWSASDATLVRLDPVLGPQQPAGRSAVWPGQTTTYTLVAAGAGGETRRTVTITVATPPSPSSITGGSITGKMSGAPKAQKGLSAADYERVHARAEQGDAVAQSNLGYLYQSGRGVPKDDTQAVAWYRKSADQGNGGAQNDLAEMYHTGTGVPKDDAQAVAWYRKAADQGNIRAEFNLAFMYLNGLGVFKDDAQAAAWYRKAAEHGFGPAQNSLGLMYENGWGVPKDRTQAIDWYRKAADDGNVEAKNALKRLGVAQK